MKKRLLSILLALVMALSLLPVSALAVDEPEGNETDTIWVTIYTGTPEIKDGKAYYNTIEGNPHELIVGTPYSTNQDLLFELDYKEKENKWEKDNEGIKQLVVFRAETDKNTVLEKLGQGAKDDVENAFDEQNKLTDNTIFYKEAGNSEWEYIQSNNNTWKDSKHSLFGDVTFTPDGKIENKPPEKPTENDVGMLLASGAVKVECTNTNVSHEAKTYGLLTGSYTIGAVEGDATNGYTCTITVTPDAYVALYNEEISANHTLTPESQTGTITLHYAPVNADGTVSTWQVKSVVPVTFTVVCGTPEPEKPATPTDEQLIKLLAGKITVDCVNTEIDPEHDNKTYGLLTDSYEIGDVTGNKTDGYFCNVTIKPATYVAEYNKTLPGHTAVATTTDKTIVLEMGGTGWIVSSGAPVTFYVECVSYTLTYDANGGKIGEETSVKTSGLTAQKDYALNKAIVPTYTVAEGEPAIVFIGWTAAQDSKIYAVGDAAPKTIEKVDIDRDVTVYAAWGYDTNGDGKADVNQIPVYVYAKFENSADQQIKALPLNDPFSLELNEHGWLTLGYVLVDGMVTEKAAVAELEEGFFPYDVNAAFDLSLVSSSSWTLTQADGADNYVGNGTTCYHLDGVIPVYRVTYDANGGAGAPDADQYLLPATHSLSTTKPTHEKVNNVDVDVVFIGWTAEKDEYIYAAGDTAPVTISQVTVPANDAAGNETDVTVYAVYGLDTNNNGIADVLETKYTVTYTDGVENKEVFEDQVYNNLLVGDDTPAFDGTPTRPGYRFFGWTPEWSETVTGDVTYTAQWRRSYHHTTSTEAKPTLNKADHYAYVVGYPDGTVQPQGAITRAEVATIFFRLLSDETRDLYWTKDNGYTDVKAGDWFNNAVSTLSNAGIINGYPDGTFRPNAPITRAEMAKVIAMFAELDKDSEGFKDIAGHWAEAYIKLAAGNGWIAGYPDGTFRPDQYITRAETMTMINRVLERVPSEEEHLLSHRVMLTFPDNQPGDWYYIAVQEATNSHTYERYATEKNGDEQWIKLIDNYDWTKLEF